MVRLTIFILKKFRSSIYHPFFISTADHAEKRKHSRLFATYASAREISASSAVCINPRI